MTEKINPRAFGVAAAAVSALIMLILGVLGRLGLYMEPVRMMKAWHIFFSTSAPGIVAGMAESAVSSFVLGYAFVWLYNRLA